MHQSVGSTLVLFFSFSIFCIIQFFFQKNNPLCALSKKLCMQFFFVRYGIVSVYGTIQKGALPPFKIPHIRHGAEGNNLPLVYCSPLSLMYFVRSKIQPFCSATASLLMLTKKLYFLPHLPNVKYLSYI